MKIRIVYTALFICFNLSISMANAISMKYLKQNRQDLLKNNTLEITKAKVIGFGALHGSARTEEVELRLLDELVNNHNLKYYFPETDYSTAHYFQEYLATGNETLLKELIVNYGKRVPQECSIEVFEKWKKLRNLFKGKDIKILGIDEIANYKFSVKQLVELIDSTANLKHIELLKDGLNKNINWSAYFNSIGKRLIEEFLADYKEKPENYREYILDFPEFNHITNNLKATFNTDRENRMLLNYSKLNKRYNLQNNLQFFRMGIFHIMKSPINKSNSFFSKLIKENFYSPEKIITIQGFLNRSKVLWEVKYDKFGLYNGYDTKKGYGTSDYWLEYFKGIGNLKRTRLSDITIFKLNTPPSVYDKNGQTDLITIKKLLGRTPWKPMEGKCTLDYIDYAILIRNSEASRPIQELSKKEKNKIE